MASFIIEGGHNLKGEIQPQSKKRSTTDFMRSTPYTTKSDH